jgi:anti-sigma factor RsiW
MSESQHPTRAHIDCDTLLEWLPAYCAGVLDAEDRAQFEAALPTCPDAQSEMAAYRRMSAGLLFAAPQVTPSAAARARLLAALDDAPPAGTSAPLRAWSPPMSPSPSPAQTGTRRPDVQIPLGAGRRMPLWAARTPLWASLLVAGFVVLLGINVFLLNRIGALEARLAPTPVPLVSELGVGALGRIELVSTGGVEGQEGRMGWVETPDGQAWVTWLVVENLPSLGAGEVYHLWLAKADEAPLSVGQFRTEAETTAFAFVIGEPIEAFDRAFVTRERADAATPSGEAVIAAEV